MPAATPSKLIRTEAPLRRSYRTLVVDPPWPGPGSVPAFQAHKRLRVVLPYHTMTGIQVSALNVPGLAADGAQLFLWATCRGLGDAYLLLQTWGFPYRAMFVWKKPLGLGKHVRHEAEFLIWGARPGAPQVAQRDRPRQVHEWPRRGHSEKPEEAYALIRTLSRGPRLDVFARQERSGFERWGAEAAELLGLRSA